MPRKKGTGTKTGTESGTGTKSGTGTRKPRSKNKSYNFTEVGALKRKYSNAVINGTLPAETSEEFKYNARQIEHVMRIMEIAKHANKDDLDSLKSCFAAYLQLCSEDGFRLGNLAACASMGISYQLLNVWAGSDHRPDYKEFAMLVKSVCSLTRENLISESKINPVIGIFWQRNFDGLRNDTEQIQSIKEDETSDYTATEYRKKYGDITDD